MGFNKKVWKNRLGLGLNKFSMNGGDPVTFDNAPDGVWQEGDYISAENLNDLEDRISDESDSVDGELHDEVEDRISEDNAIRQVLDKQQGNVLPTLLRRQSFTVSGTGTSYAQVACDIDGYTPLGVIGFYWAEAHPLQGLHRGYRIITSGGVNYARVYWYNPNNETFSVQVTVLYIKNTF